MSIVRDQGMAEVVITVIHGMCVRKFRGMVDVVIGHRDGVGQGRRGVVVVYVVRAVEPTTVVMNTSNETRAAV